MHYWTLYWKDIDKMTKEELIQHLVSSWIIWSLHKTLTLISSKKQTKEFLSKTIMKLKYWDKVRITSWFYEGMEWTLYKLIDNYPSLNTQGSFYQLKLESLSEYDCLVIEHQSNLELIK